jgi:DNA-binding IclR family transcriptional regulator
MRTLDRLIAILETVATSERPVSPARVAEVVGLSLSTVARLMNQMAHRQLLDRSERNGTYTLGARLFAIARAGAEQHDLRRLAQPLMEQLRDVTGETVSLHVRTGGRRVCIAEVPSRHEVRRVIPLGLSLSLYGSATGEVLLAGAPVRERQDEIDALGLSPKERSALEARLERIRQEGWAILVDEAVKGVAGLSAAITDGVSTVAALSVSGPSSRFTERVARSHVDALLQATSELSVRVAGFG